MESFHVLDVSCANNPCKGSECVVVEKVIGNGSIGLCNCTKNWVGTYCDVKKGACLGRYQLIQCYTKLVKLHS